MLKIEHLKKSYENFSLDCSLEVKKGHVTGLIGQNGAGKSTTFKAILGLISFDSGTINILGKSLQDFTAKDKYERERKWGKMKKYEYLEIDYTAKGVVFLCTDKHKEVINSYAENGYRYVGFIPTEIDAKGCMRKIDLIFEKED